MSDTPAPQIPAVTPAKSPTPAEILRAMVSQQASNPVVTKTPAEIAIMLPARLKSLGDSHKFEKEQLVKWKAGLKNRLRPQYDQPAIVVSMIDKVSEDGEPIDILLAVIGEDDGFHVFPYDSRRFEPFS